MTAAERNRRHRRLERAGFVAVNGWVPAAFAKRVEAQIEAYRDEVEAAADTDLPRGRPPKVDAD